MEQAGGQAFTGKQRVLTSSLFLLLSCLTTWVYESFVLKDVLLPLLLLFKKKDVLLPKVIELFPCLSCPCIKVLEPYYVMI
jgi:hypothetical protein